jgi:hypothetical protein
MRRASRCEAPPGAIIGSLEGIMATSRPNLENRVAIRVIATRIANR